jgi:class 3 adenylate cyclase
MELSLLIILQGISEVHVSWSVSVGLLLIIIVGLYFFYKDRISRVKKQKDLLESQVKQRTIEIIKQKEKVERQKSLLEEEKEKTEKLLLNILPREMADELKNKGKAKARNYRQATVMFTDFKGFTKLAESLPPQELVAELDSYFIQFDEIVNKYNVEKIKTIGDAYMCAGGVPIRNKSNAIDTVLAALEIQRAMLEMKEKRLASGKHPWEIRIGLHSGDLIAGVVGIKRFAYDIWGDTVNVAAHMESSGEVGKVNISETTYEAIAEFFTTEYRGKVKAKNKGEIDMYFVHSIKPELSENEDGITPNEAFWHYVNLKLYSNINYRNAEKYIVKRLAGDLPEGLYYHGIHHTKDVCEAVERLAIWEGVKGEELYLLKTAALYHDAGFIDSYESNEPIGARLAKEMLPSFGYTEPQIEQVIDLIEATKIPQNPKNHLEEIMCDSDLDYLGRGDFYPIAETLRQELIQFGKIGTDEETWVKMNIGFLGVHKYFTKSARLRREPEKLERVEELKKKLSQIEVK